MKQIHFYETKIKDDVYIRTFFWKTICLWNKQNTLVGKVIKKDKCILRTNLLENEE